MMLRLWSRGYDWTHAAVPKATSNTGRVAARLLRARSEARAVYLNLRAKPYLATLLAGANSMIDFRGHGPGRMRRLVARRAPPLAPLHSLSAGELAALGWLVETLSCQEAVAAHPDRILPFDFDDFLKDVAGGVARVLTHFGLPTEPTFLAEIAASPVLRRYSKAPEQTFPPEEREAPHLHSRRENREEIARGMAWIGRMARVDGTVASLQPGVAA